MPDADISITPGSGAKVDTRTVGAGTDEHRQVVVVGDPATAAAVGVVANATPGASDYGPVVRPIPSGTQAVSGTFWQATQPISGTVTADAGDGPWPVTDNGGSLTVDGPLTDTQLRAVAVPVSGTVTANAGSGPFPVSDNGGSLTVDGTFWQATQPVSGPLTDTQLRASAVPVATTLDPAIDTINSAITAAHPVLDTRAVLFAVNAGGTYGNIERTNGGNLKVAVEEFDAALPAGTNNIGDVDVLTLPALPAGTNNIGDVDVLTLPALPAGGNTIGTVLAAGTIAHDAVDSGAPVKIGGKATAVTTQPTAVAAADRVDAWLDLLGRQIIAPRKLPTYSAAYRLGSSPYPISKAMASSTFQFATIHHANTATKTVKLRRIELVLHNNTAAATITAEVVRITTAPATGNPAITPAPHSLADGSAEVTCLALPTTNATESAILSTRSLNLGIGAGGTANPLGAGGSLVLYEVDSMSEEKLLEIRAGFLEGYAVTLRATGNTTLTASINIVFTEETP